jgi:transposase
MTKKALSDIRRKKKVLDYAQKLGNVSQTCRYFGISRETFYQWKRAFKERGEEGLINQKPCPQNPKLRTPKPVEELIIHLRKTYHLGQLRIKWYLERYHEISISEGAVYNVLKRNGLNKLPQNQRKRSMKAFKRYEKKVPGHRIQVDVKFLSFRDKTGKRLKDINTQLLMMLPGPEH